MKMAIKLEPKEAGREILKIFDEYNVLSKKMLQIQTIRSE